MSGAYHFEKDGGGEQDYGVIPECPIDEMIGMLTSAKERSLDMVAIMDAECDVVMITTQRIANLLIPVLNDAEIHPLDGLNYVGDKVPDDVLETRRIEKANRVPGKD